MFLHSHHSIITIAIKETGVHSFVLLQGIGALLAYKWRFSFAHAPCRPQLTLSGFYLCLTGVS